MKAAKTRLILSLAVIAAIFAIPGVAVAAEEAVVPPSNSAATQYTETFPTTGGDKKTDQKPKHRSPDKVLGSHNTKKLEKQGPEGKAAAEAAAATAPATVTTPAPSTQSDQSDRHGGGGGGHSKGSGGGGKGGAGDAAQPQSNAADDSQTISPQASEPAGSSGIGSAIGQATGLSSSGQSGTLLPLVILATIIWSLVYFWRLRQRRQVG